jgi:uncharacterized integral membrane protein (TIGR00698 family)
MNYGLVSKYIRGMIVPLLIAVVSILLGNTFPIIGGNIFALFIGMIASLILPAKIRTKEGLRFASKGLLQMSIILLGTSLSITQVLVVGKYSLFVMVFTLTAAYGSGYIFGRLLKLDWKLSSLISTGTGVCGGSAIATLSPIIDADDTDIAYAMSATFIFDILMILLFPLMGKMLDLSDLSYGLWTGTAVNDTSSVVAAGYAFSDAAGDFATIVKLTRTTSIVPIALVFSAIAGYRNSKDNVSQKEKHISIKKLFPWFILLFVLSVALNTLGFIPVEAHPIFKHISKFLMAVALGAIGLRTDLKEMIRSGAKPMLLGFIVSAIVVVVSISVQYLTGQV